MKKIIILFTLILSNTIYSQSFNRSSQIKQETTTSQIIFYWDKDVVSSIVIKSLDDDFTFPKIDAFLTTQLTLNSLSSGNYEVIFLDNCSAIIDIKQFEIK